MNVIMSKPGPGGSLQNEDPDKTGGYHVYRPTGRPSHSSLACAGFRGQTELSELALWERCVASRRPHPLALVACGCRGLESFVAPSCRSFRQLCPSLEKPRPGFPFDVVVNASGGCLFAWFFVFFFPDFTTGLYCLRKEGRKEGKKYALSLLSLWGCGVCSQELSEVVRCVLWGESRGFCVLLFEHVLRLRCEVVEFFGVKDWERVLFRGRGRAP